MATTNPPTTRSDSRRAGANSTSRHMENAYDEVKQAAGDLKQTARATGREMQTAAEKELEMVRGNARDMSRRTALMIRRHPWSAVGAALLVGAIAGRFL